MNDINQIFLGEGLEELTDDLINDLVASQGMPKEDLLKMKEQGVKYSRPRGSFIMPPDVNLSTSLKKNKKKLGSIR